MATYNITYHLHQLGHRVSLASLNTQKHFQDPAVLASVAEVATVEIDTRIRPTQALQGLFSAFPYNVSRFKSPAFERLLQDLIRTKAPDLIQLEGSYQAIFIPAIRKVAPEIPILLRSHNIEWRIWQRLAENEGNPLKHLYLNNLWPKIRNFEASSLHQFDGVVAITAEDEAWYRQQGFKGLLTTIPAGADLSQYRHGEGFAPAHTVGFIGSLEWEPNVQGVKWMVEHIWPKVLQQCPQAEFHIAGKNPPEALQSLQDQPGIHFHGMVPDAADFIRGFRIFVVPLRSGSGMRLKIVEALAMRKCVVSTSVGAEGIEIRPEEDYAVADQADEFAQKLVDLIQDGQRAIELAQSGHARIRELYDWKQLIHRYIEVYRNLQ